MPGLRNGQHVKAHQAITPSSPWEVTLLNDCDATAKTYRTHHTFSVTPRPATPTSIHIKHKGDRITGNEIHITRWTWRNKVFHEYMEDRLSLSTQEMTEIHWTAYASAKKTFPPAMHPFIVKLLNRWLATGTRCVKYGSAIDKCHRCSETETYNHLFVCNQQNTTKIAVITSLTALLASINTKPGIQEAIIQGITKWFHGDSPTEDDLPLDHIGHTPYAQQSQIGWDITMSGLFHSSWAAAQADDPKSSTKWQASLSREMIQQSHHIWITRCNERHAPDTDQPSHTTQGVLTQLKKLYELATANLSQFEFRQLFGQTKEALRQFPTKTLQEWIPPMYHAVRNQIARSTANVGLQDIRQFFQPRNLPIINQTPITAQAHHPHTAPTQILQHTCHYGKPSTTSYPPARGEEHLREGGPPAPPADEPNSNRHS
jgi:hypothetical protein